MAMPLVYKVVSHMLTGIVMIHIFGICVPRKEKGIKGMGLIITNEIIYRMIALIWFTGGTLQSEKIILYLLYMIVRLVWFEKASKEALRSYLLTYIYLVVGEAASLPIVLSVYKIFTGRFAANLTDSQSSLNDMIAASLVVSVTFVLILLANRWNIGNKCPMIVLEVTFYLMILSEIYALVSWDYIYSGEKASIIIPKTIVVSLLVVCAWLINQKSRAKAEAVYTEREMARQLDQFAVLSRRQDEIRKFRHDLANHLDTIKRAEEVALDEYQKQLIEYNNKILLEVHVANVEKEEYQTSEKTSRAERRVEIFLLLAFCLATIIVIWGVGADAKKTIVSSVFGLLIFGAIIYVVLSRKWLLKENIHRSSEIAKRRNTNEEWEREQERIVKEQTEKIKTFSKENLRALDEQLLISTGSRIVDAMMQMKYQQFTMEGIKEEVRLFVPEHGTVEEADMVSLLCNMIDNGIEANIRVAKEKRWIKIESNIKANYWIVTVCNAKPLEDKPLKRRFQSIKKDRTKHGYGVRIIEDIVKKYDGSMKAEDLGEIFKMIVILNCKMTFPFKRER